MAGPIQALEQRRADTSRNAENSAREAFCYGRFQTVGWGEVKAASPILFDVTFTSKPAISYGFEVIGGQTAVIDGRFPRGNGGVYQWVQDNRGHYTGAYILVTVENISAWTAPSATTAGPDYTIEHNFKFEGPAYKALPGLGG